MPTEQPPRTICEICGGTHSTGSHIDTNDKKRERAREKEPNHEAMEKAVDLFTTEDLKYRNDPILPTLETGVPTPLTGFLYEPFGRVDVTIREEMRKTKTAREQERERIQTEASATKTFGTKFRQSANVFYPEGLLKYLKDRVLHTKTIEPWSKKDNDIAEGQLGDWGADYNITAKLSGIFKGLIEGQKEQVARSVGLSSGEIQKTLNGEYPGLDLDKPRHEKEKQLRVILETLFSNAQFYESLRRAWLKKFFDSGNKDASRGLQDSGFNLKVGLVLSPDTKVAVSPHDDYPTQATILSSRVKPRDIIGIFVNSDRKEQSSLFEDEAVWHAPYGQETPLKQLESSVFHIPEHPIEYLFAHYAHSFILFLEKNGVEIDKIKPYFPEYQGRSFGDKEMKKEKEITGKIREALNDEEFNRIKMLAKKFIEEKSPVKSGETLWTGLTRIAEHHQLPIYNTRGELLWPKHMTYEQVAELVAKKAENKE